MHVYRGSLLHGSSVSSLESSVKLEDVFVVVGRPRILGQNTNVGPTEGRVVGLLSALSSWVCMLESHAVLQGALGRRRDGVHLRGAELGLM